jgi:hypothetical protein
VRSWLADSIPVECGRSRETAKRSDLVIPASLPQINGYAGGHP